ncbi:MAG: AMP-binding protein [Flavobacteriales bacterium]
MADLFYINNQVYSRSALIERSLQFHEEDWEKSHWDFIRNWFDETDFIYSKTSGSTGEAKEIAIPKKSMIASAQLTQSYFNFNPGIKALVALPSEFIGGKMMILRSLLFGYHQLWLKPSTRPLDSLIENVDFTALTPLQVTDQLNSNASAFEKVKTVIIGGQKVSEVLNERLEKLSSRFVSTYGMTETTSHIALRELNQPKQDFFTTLGNTTVDLDQRGCLVIDASHLNIDKLVTNDLAECSSNQRFKILGRVDFMINTGGAKVNPELIEDRLAAWIETPFLVTSETDERLGQKVILVIESSKWDEQRITELDKKMKVLFSSLELPRAIYFVDQLNRTTTGKIIRKWN